MSAAFLAAPAILPTRLRSQTPVIDGRRVRRRLSTLADDDPFFAAYAAAVTAMHELPEDDPHSWLAQARTHADHCKHGDPNLGFLAWHRPYLDYFERICGALIGDEGFALPYWDWRDNNGRMPAPFFANDALNVEFWADPSNYNAPQWGLIQTGPSRYASPTLGLKDDPRYAGGFSDESLADIQNLARLDDFSNALETPHGTAHVIAGGFPGVLGDDLGHMSNGLSPLDPIFWLHHANVDRMWSEVATPLQDQLAYLQDPQEIYSGMFVDETGTSVDDMIADTFDLGRYGYTYDSLLPQLASPEDLAVEEQTQAAQPQLLEFAASRGLSASGAPEVRETVGRLDEAGTIAGGSVRRLDFTVDPLVDILTTTRIGFRRSLFEDGAIALETGRVLARLSVTPLAGSEGQLVNVFVNCPYLSEVTPTTDPHFAGTFSFFGCPPEICARREFVVEVTRPLGFKLAQGALAGSDVQVQLLPVSGAQPGQPIAEIGSAELISI